jgi:hypothetical protein
MMAEEEEVVAEDIKEVLEEDCTSTVTSLIRTRMIAQVLAVTQVLMRMIQVLTKEYQHLLVDCLEVNICKMGQTGTSRLFFMSLILQLRLKAPAVLLLMVMETVVYLFQIPHLVNPQHASICG